MQVHEGQNDLGSIEFDIFLTEVSLFLEVEEQVATIDVLNNEEEVRGSLKGVV